MTKKTLCFSNPTHLSLRDGQLGITCDSNHVPIGLLLPLAGNTIQNERFRHHEKRDDAQKSGCF